MLRSIKRNMEIHGTGRMQRPLLVTLVLALLLFMQTAMLLHQLDLDAHVDGDNRCELCIGLAGLDHGLSTTAQPLPSLQWHPAPLLLQRQTFPALVPASSYRPRAPPARFTS